MLILVQDRRKIEAEAFSGNLLGIVATNALELGVDIGVLDAVIMLGFPMGGLASFVSIPDSPRTRPIADSTLVRSASKQVVRVVARAMRSRSMWRTSSPSTNIMFRTPRSCSTSR